MMMRFRGGVNKAGHLRQQVKTYPSEIYLVKFHGVFFERYLQFIVAIKNNIIVKEKRRYKNAHKEIVKEKNISYFLEIFK